MNKIKDLIHKHPVRGIGWSYDPDTGKFVAPPQPEEEVPAVE